MEVNQGKKCPRARQMERNATFGGTRASSPGAWGITVGGTKGRSRSREAERGGAEGACLSDGQDPLNCVKKGIRESREGPKRGSKGEEME